MPKPVRPPKRPPRLDSCASVGQVLTRLTKNGSKFGLPLTEASQAWDPLACTLESEQSAGVDGACADHRAGAAASARASSEILSKVLWPF